MRVWFSLIICAACLTGSDLEIADARRFFQQQDFVHAAALLNSIVTSNPAAEIGLYRILSESYAAMGDLPAAVNAAELGLRAHPRSTMLEEYLGQLLFRANPKDTRAGQFLTSAARALPHDPEAHHYLAQWAYLNHRQELAVSEESAGLIFAGSNDFAKKQMYLILALAQAQLDRLDRADAAFRRAIESNHKLPAPDPMCDYQYVDFLNRRGRGAEAPALAEAILKYAPEFGPARLERAKALARAHDLEQAAAEGELALSQMAGDRDLIRAAHYFLAKTYLQLKEIAAAQTHQAWLESHP